jgi:hypothetical protein
METQATITGHAEAGRGRVPAWLPMLVYVILLSIVSEVLAFTAYGLIARWARCSRAGSPAYADGECHRSPPSSPQRSAPAS